MNHVTHEYLTKMLLFLDPVGEFICIDITSLYCPVFPVCHISVKQLLIKRYLKHYKPLPDCASTNYVVCVYYKHDKLALFHVFLYQ